jgi:hypothetical protein
MKRAPVPVCRTKASARVGANGRLQPSCLASPVPSLTGAVLQAFACRTAVALPVHRAPAMATVRADFGNEAASADVRRLARWIIETRDNGALDFVVVDKRNAKVFVFEAQGRLAGATPVLLGLAVGDDTALGVASKPLSQILPAERTTPAGRFLSQAGLNAEQEEVIWVDYDAAVSMHRVRPTHASERRLERLASPTSADNRISSGCTGGVLRPGAVAAAAPGAPGSGLRAAGDPVAVHGVCPAGARRRLIRTRVLKRCQSATAPHLPFLTLSTAVLMLSWLPRLGMPNGARW